MRSVILGFPLVILGGYGLYSLPTPSLERDWTVDQAIPATATITEDIVTLTNVRNFTYRSTTDYTPDYYDTTVKLSELTSVDFIVEPFGSVGAAHTFLSFGFADGQQIAISAEIRKEVGESFSPWLGMLRQYELMYVIADERDVIGLRANHRKHDVYLYPTTATKEEGRKLFVNMLTRANALMTSPEFYNTVTNNCTTNIVQHINELRDEPLRYDIRMLLPAEADALAQELGFIALSTGIEEAREKYLVNEKAKVHQFSRTFSKQIREAQKIDEAYEVVKVIDGDTIDVRINGEVKRVRYIGIDTPEKYPEEKAQCLADEAKLLNENFVSGQRVSLVKDIRDIDDYGRLLRYVYVDDFFVNEELVANGLARAVVYEPDNSQAKVFDLAERQAKDQQRGIWSGVCIE